MQCSVCGINAYLDPGQSQVLGTWVISTCTPCLKEVTEVNRPSYSARDKPAFGVGRGPLKQLQEKGKLECLPK